VPNPPAGVPSRTSALTLTDAIGRLSGYWAAQGCAIMQPYNTEVGAGTLNPATFLRVLGPEPWRVAYVEPSVRPDDARYGENPNRLQTHTQYQVILKPEPGNAQDLYLGSLAALGIDLAAHDVRFVEDNWASPALGAWGLGWEVWLDGLEITQFTYFQQAGGFSLDPVSVELTYGLERILMALQGVRHFKDIAYAEGLAYGDVFAQAEYEWSRYYLDEADVDAVGALFSAYEREAERMIGLRLPVPAYSYVLKCSHAFNIVDARGAISPTERARSFARMRHLAHQVADLWVERRKEEGFPLGRGRPSETPAVAEGTPVVVAEPAATEAAPVVVSVVVATEPAPAAPTAPATLVFEIGTEELPAGDVTATAQMVRAALVDRLGATRLAHGAVTVCGSPRRITAMVAGVAPEEKDRHERVRGPKRSAAFGADGTATKAAEGFARGHGATPADLSTWDVNGVAYVGVERHVAGRPAIDVLREVLPGIVGDLRSADKNMRWNAPGLAFVRPIRRIVALLGDAVVPFRVANLTSARVTFVHRRDPEPDRTVPAADAYFDILAGAGITVDEGRRRELVRQQVDTLARGEGGTAEVDDSLVAEVANLVEEPNAILGHFEPDYLDLPAEILVTVMRKHQRYFPVRAGDGALLPAFVTVANGPCDPATVRAGNESVLRARYEDARFFWTEDLGRRPEEFHAGLDRLAFAERLGSMGDRSGRIGSIALDLYDALPIDVIGLDDGVNWAVLERATALVKFDLATQMVTELTSLAGIMAREYARRAGEPDAVADALFDQELPRHSSDALPAGLPGALLSVAARADLLAGLFAVGADPTGSSDPYALRRAALGLLAVLAAHPDLQAIAADRVIEIAGAAQPVPWTDEIRGRVVDFLARRWETQQIDNGRPASAVRAVLPRFVRPAQAEEDLTWLIEHRSDPVFTEVAQALGRAARIIKPDTEAAWDRTTTAEPAEGALREAVSRFAPVPAARGGVVALAAFVDAARALVTPINQFFDELLVMADDPAIRANRLGLLATIRDAAQAVIDWTALD